MFGRSSLVMTDVDSWEASGPVGLKRGRGDEPNHTDLAVALLKSTGTKALGKAPMDDGSTTYAFLGKTSKVSAVVNVKNGGTILHAYTTHGPSNDDNFNKMNWCGFDGHRMLGTSVENATFGAGKILVELDFIDNMYREKGPVLLSLMPRLLDAAKNADHRHFFADKYTELTRYGCDANKISDQVLCYILFENFLATEQVVISFKKERDEKIQKALMEGKTPPESLDADPVFLLCESRLPRLVEWKNNFYKNPDLGLLVSKYRENRMEVLQLLAICNPAIAKLGAGRSTVFPFILQKWENEKYAEIAVAYARRCMFYANPTQLYIFWMFNCHADAQSEMSTNDKIWANEIKRAKGDPRGALDSFLPLQHGQEHLLDSVKAEREKVIEMIPIKKKLAFANMDGVLASIRKEVTGFGDGGFLDNPEHMRYLTKIGWVEWFNTYVMGPHQRGVFDCKGTLDDETKDLLKTTTKGDVVDFLDTLMVSL